MAIRDWQPAQLAAFWRGTFVAAGGLAALAAGFGYAAARQREVWRRYLPTEDSYYYGTGDDPVGRALDAAFDRGIWFAAGQRLSFLALALLLVVAAGVTARWYATRG
jgi:hypothetical protein